MTDNTQELDEILQPIRNYADIVEIDVAKQAIIDWHNKQVEAITETTYNNLPGLDKLTVGNEMSDGYDQGVEEFRQAMIKALYGKETN